MTCGLTDLVLLTATTPANPSFENLNSKIYDISKAAAAQLQVGIDVLNCS